jgi:hypothetical protein
MAETSAISTRDEGGSSAGRLFQEVFMKKSLAAAVAALSVLGLPALSRGEEAQQRLVDAPQAPAVKTGYKVWPNQPPPECPFPQSASLVGIGFTGRHAEYTGADTWYPSWAADGHQYSPWTDGNVNGLNSNSAGKNATTGQARIVGDDPLKLQVIEQSVYKSDPAPYASRYPCGSLVHDGVWYYGTYCLHPSGGVKKEDGITYNWPWLGPFVGFRW